MLWHRAPIAAVSEVTSPGALLGRDWPPWRDLAWRDLAWRDLAPPWRRRASTRLGTGEAGAPTSPGFARKVARRVVFMDQGAIVADADEDALGTPRSERAQLFLSKILQHPIGAIANNRYH
jgi:hypothetical protein